MAAAGETPPAFADGSQLEVDVVVFHRHSPARYPGRYGDLPSPSARGIVIDDHCLTADPDIYAIGEAPWQGRFGWWRRAARWPRSPSTICSGGDSRSRGGHERQAQAARRLRRLHR